jgi:branched chain amino acid efflux pump
MNQMDTFCMVGGMALVTLLIRCALLPFSGRIRFSSGLKRALAYVPPAVLMAIVTPMVLMPKEQALQLTLANPYLVGAVATAIIGWWRKTLFTSFVGGMCAFLLWQWILHAG